MFASINDHLDSRDLLSRLIVPATAEIAVWPAIKDVLESMGEIMDVLKEGGFQKITPKPVFMLSPGFAHLPDGLKFVYAMIALISEKKYDVLIPSSNREVEARNPRPLRSELLAVWSDISNAMRGFKNQSLHMLVLDEVVGLELSNFSKQLKTKPGTDDDHQMIVGVCNDLWFTGMELDEKEKPERQNAKDTKAHLEAMVLRTKPGANKWLLFFPRVAALGMDAFERSPMVITKIHADLVRESTLAENDGKKSAEFIDRMCQITLEVFWMRM